MKRVWTRGSIAAVVMVLGCSESYSAREGGGGAGIDLEGETDGAVPPGPGDDGGSSGSGDDPTGPDDDDDGDSPAPADEDPGPEVPFDPDQLARVCDRGNGDRVAQALCADTQLDSMEQLLDTLAFDDPFFALSGNSSSLVARDVSAINPRLVVGENGRQFDDLVDFDLNNLMALGFARGEQFVELVGFDPIADELNFYLLMFEQACNEDPDGCSAAELVTPAVERDWTRWTLYQDTDLVDTTMDCNVCHQPLGPGTPKILRMQEVRNSWTHWFPTRPPSGGGGGKWASGGGETHGLPPADETHGTASSEILWSQFERMHALEGSYGGVPITTLSEAEAGPDLEQFVLSFLAQRELPEELAPSVGEFDGSSSDYFVDSALTEVQGPQVAWQAQFERTVAGERLPVPSHRIDITDEAQREAAIESYLDVLTGVAPPEELVDPRHVASVSAKIEMSLVPRPDASAEEILTHMCSRCHNSNLDATLTRARFDATDLSTVSDDMKDLIANRVLRDDDDRYQMPPARFGSLPPWAVDRVLQWVAD